MYNDLSNRLPQHFCSIIFYTNVKLNIVQWLKTIFWSNILNYKIINFFYRGDWKNLILTVKYLNVKKNYYLNNDIMCTTRKQVQKWIKMNEYLMVFLFFGITFSVYNRIIYYTCFSKKLSLFSNLSIQFFIHVWHLVKRSIFNFPYNNHTDNICNRKDKTVTFRNKLHSNVSKLIFRSKSKIYDIRVNVLKTMSKSEF